MNLDRVDILELIDRYNFLIQEYVELAKDLIPRLERFGKYRKELQILTAEFIKRGVTIEDKEGLVRIVEEEIAKRKNKIHGEQETDQGSGHRESI